GSVLSCPVCEFGSDDRIASARVRARQRHDDQLLLGGEFEPQVAIVATKLEKLLRGQAEIFDVENQRTRHNLLFKKRCSRHAIHPARHCIARDEPPLVNAYCRVRSAIRMTSKSSPSFNSSIR